MLRCCGSIYEKTEKKGEISFLLIFHVSQLIQYFHNQLIRVSFTGDSVPLSIAIPSAIPISHRVHCLRRCASAKIPRPAYPIRIYTDFLPRCFSNATETILGRVFCPGDTGRGASIQFHRTRPWTGWKRKGRERVTERWKIEGWVGKRGLKERIEEERGFSGGERNARG